MFPTLTLSLLFSLIIGILGASPKKLVSIYRNSPPETVDYIQSLKIKNPTLVEVAKGQKDIVISLLLIRGNTLSPSSIYDSTIEYRIMNMLANSGFLLDINDWREGEDFIYFEGNYFLSSYVTMSWLQEQHNYQKSLVIMKDQFLNQVEKKTIQQIIDEMITTKEWNQQEGEEIPNSIKQTEALIQKHKPLLTEASFIQVKCDETKILSYNMEENKKVKSHYVKIYNQIKPLFFILNEKIVINIILEIKQSSYKESKSQFRIESFIYRALYSQTPILLFSNDINLESQKTPQSLMSIYIDEINQAVNLATNGYLKKNVALIEVPESQYQKIISEISSSQKIQTKVVEAKIIKSPVAMKEIHLLYEMGYLKSDIENTVIFNNPKYLFSQYLLRKNCVTDNIENIESFKYIFSKLMSKVKREKFFKIAQILTNKTEFEAVLITSSDHNRKEVIESADSKYSSSHICDGGEEIKDSITYYDSKFGEKYWIWSKETLIQRIGKVLENYLIDIHLVLSKTEMKNIIKKINLHIKQTKEYYEKEECDATNKYAQEYYLKYLIEQIKIEFAKRSPISFKGKSN